MSENTDSFFFLDDEKTYQIFDPLQNDFKTKCEDYSFNRITKPDIFKITNYKFLKKKREESIMKSNKKRQWTSEEDHKLTHLVSIYKQFSWEQISSFFFQRTPSQCMNRWTKVLQPFLKKGKWTEDEDKILLKWVEQNGPQKWSKLSLILNGRSSKQIRDRWVNNLNPDKRKDFIWTEELDRILLIKYLENGSSWVTISKYIDHTTENMIKNRFYSLLRSTASKYKTKYKSQNSNRNRNGNICFNLSYNNKNLSPSNKICMEYLNFFEEKEKKTENLWIFDFSEEADDKKTKSFANSNTSGIKYKKNNYNLCYLLNFLPYLLEEKQINPDSYITCNTNMHTSKIITTLINEQNPGDKKEKVEDTNPNSRSYSNNDFNLCSTSFVNSHDMNNQNKAQILTKFFDTLSQKFSYNNYEGKTSQEDQKAQFKFKSTILLNLQLTLLHKIFDRLKLQVIHRFFECFKENTISP